MTKKNKTKQKVLAGSVAVIMLTNSMTPVMAMTPVIEESNNEAVTQVEEVSISEQVQPETIAEEVVTSQKEEKSQQLEVDEEEEPKQEEASDIMPITQQIEVDNYADLKDAVAQNDVTINIIGDITLENEQLWVSGNNVTINGGDNVINLNETTNVDNKFQIRGENVKIENLTFKGHVTVGIYAYKAKDLVLNNVTLEGTANKSQVGIDLDSATVTMRDITSENHKYSGIRFRNKSTAHFETRNVHKEDFKEIEFVKDGNKFTQATEEYAEAGKDTKNNKEFYNLITTVEVNSYSDLKKYINRHNTVLDVKADINIPEKIEVTSGRIQIKGNDNKFNMLGKGIITIKAEKVGIDGVTFENYKSGGLQLYNAKGATLSNLKFIGNNTDVKNDKSTFGLDIYNSTSIKLDNIRTENHLYRGIQVRNGSEVVLLSQNVHVNDKVHLQIIQKDGEKESVVNNGSEYYVVGTPIFNKSNNTTTTDYFMKNEVSVNSTEDFKKYIGVSGSILELQGNITFTPNDIPEGQEFLELIVGSNVVIEGNGAVLDMGGCASITFKGNDISMNDITIKYSTESGIQLYNSKNVVIEGSEFVNSENYGLIVNGSTVTLKNVFTGYNKDGGILITRSRTLTGENHTDSKVIIQEGITHVESNINVEVLNLQMVHDETYFQNNQFIAPEHIYTKHVNDEAYKALSQTYIDHFGLKGDDAKKKYKEQSIDYMIHQTQIDVTTQDIVKDEQDNPIHLVGDGKTDNTENLIKLFTYAAQNGVQLFFPEGVYKITEDINLEEIDLPALSNFKVVGEEGKLSVIDGSSELDRMLKIKNAGYHAEMNYVSFENMVFNNVGLEFNGVYKRGVTMHDNVFMNGKYTKEYNADGEFYKATMVPYIISNNSKYEITGNVFLRGKEYVGRGIATYRTKNSIIKDNFFGDLSALDHASGMLPEKVINKAELVKSTYAKSKDLNINGSQGNFFTAINNERYDTNVTITNNYFKLDETREINSDFGKTILVSGINVTKEGQRRDHIIYSKGYDGLNIYGNYFEGMANDASGGIKIRNGKNAYIGSNHLKNVPVLTYIYGDLTKEDNTLENTVIYNNIFHETKDFGAEGTGILYYQSFRDGDTVNYQDQTVEKEVGNVNNMVIYKNQFVGNDESEITISNRPEQALANKEFTAHGNVYYDNNNMTVNYDQGNVKLDESTDAYAESKAKLNASYDKLKDTPIPLNDITTDFTELDKLLKDLEDFSIQSNIDEEVAKEVESLINEAKALKQKQDATQWEVNDLVSTILTDIAGRPIVRPDDNPNVDMDKNSLVAETVIDENGLKVTIKGDEEDLKNVSHLEITQDGIYAVVNGEKLKFGVSLDGLDLDLNDARAVRLDEKGGHLAIPHENINGTIKINSRNFENILITHRVPEPFVDVEDKHWFKGDVEDAYNYVFTKGTGGANYSPFASITRGEFAVMIARALELKPNGSTEQFKDIDGKWYASEVQALRDAGIVNGFVDGTFGGNKTITRQEAATMLVNMLKYAGMDTTPTKQADLIDMDKVGGFAKPSVQFLAEQGVISGNEFKEFKPLNNLTRSEMAKILVKSLRLTDLY